MKHVLVLVRDLVTRLELSALMRRHDIRTTYVDDHQHLLRVLSKDVVDALLLEVATNEMANVIRHLATITYAPILIVGSERTVEEDKVRGLEAGASDYICRPVGNRELVARIKAAIRDKSGGLLRSERRTYRFGHYVLFLRERRLTHTGAGDIKLTTAEFNLLTVFLGNPRAILTRARLLLASRLHEGEITDRSLDALILRLRRKIEIDPARPQLIRTVRGCGYLFDSDVFMD